MQRRGVIATVGAILGTSVGAAAYTSATVDRDASFSIESDSGTALIGLNAGTTEYITDDGDTLDVSVTDMNTDGEFTFGDGTSLDTGDDHAFSITNNDGVERSITVGYDAAQVDFTIYSEGTSWSDTDVTTEGTVDHNNDVEITAAADEEFRVVLTVDTNGIGSTDTSLGGTLTFTAN